MNNDEALAYWRERAAAHSKRIDELWTQMDAEQKAFRLANENIRILRQEEAA